jgi:hypothetical protein
MSLFAEGIKTKLEVINVFFFFGLEIKVRSYNICLWMGEDDSKKKF